MSRTRHAYDTVAESYARMLPDASYEAPLDLAMIDDFVARLDGDARVLDAGCGAGRMLAHLAALSPALRLEGVDLSSAMAALARAAHPGLQITVGELAELKYADAAFDGVLAWYSIIHTPPSRLEVTLRELRRILKPGGLLLLGFHSEQSGTEERTSTRAYGHDVELRTFLHRSDAVAATAETVGLRILARLDRAPREGERNPQSVILAER